MVATSQVRNGVIPFPEGMRLSEGQKVAVIPLPTRDAVISSHSILDIPTVSLGEMLSLASDDLLGEMLEGRQ